MSRSVGIPQQRHASYRCLLGQDSDDAPHSQHATAERKLAASRRTSGPTSLVDVCSTLDSLQAAITDKQNSAGCATRHIQACRASRQSGDALCSTRPHTMLTVKQGALARRGVHDAPHSVDVGLGARPSSGDDHPHGHIPIDKACHGRPELSASPSRIHTATSHILRSVELLNQRLAA